MHYRWLFWIILPLTLSATLPFSGDAEPLHNYQHILLLNSYHQGYKWTDDETRGVLETLGRQEKHIKVYTEYMGTKWTASAPYFQQLQETYKHKFNSITFDVIIATDNDAFNFLRSYRDETFGPVPTVFCGVNYFQPEELKGLDLFTGVSETADFKATLDLMLRLHPSTKRIVIIIDTSETGTHVFQEVSAATPLYEKKVIFEFLQDLPMEELQKRVARLPADSLVLYTFFFRDKKNQLFEHDESITLISQASHVPVYGAWDFSLGHGIIGGKLVCGFEQGKMAAEMAKRILQGERTENIPVALKSPSHFMFDYKQMQRFGIESQNLPSDSSIINGPSPFYTLSKPVVWTVGGSVALLTGFVGILLVNIRKRDQAQKNFEASEAQYHSLVDNLNIGVYRNNGGTPGFFLQANPAMLKIFGYESLDAFLQTPVAHHYKNPSDRAAFINELARTGVVQDKELKMQKKDGSSIWVSCSAKVVFDNNQSVQWIDGVLEDITEKKHMEAQLRQSQKMEALGSLAGGIAHDFNNILMVISGYGTLLRQKVEQDPAMLHYLDPILSSAEKASQLTRSLLAFSRKQVINPTPLNLKDVVDGMEQLLLRIIGEDMKLEKHHAVPNLIVLADQSQLEQILLNLVTNARDAMPGGGLISISTESIMVREKEMLFLHDLKTSGEYAVLSVSDTGGGMNEEVQQRIFEPFYSSKATGKGTGLGLSIVHGIIKQHNGDISVYSEPGKGTTFKVYLPLFKGVVENREAATQAPAVGGKETILLGEDDQNVRQWINDVLTMAGYTVIEAEDGEAVVNKFSGADHIDLVVLDVVMPKKNGKEVVEEIQKTHPDVNVLFMSGYTADIIHHKGLADKGINFISKPMQQDNLLRKIREVLESEHPAH
jgi:PAS domain S-box-containing protein